jgi:hypothetical protein
MTGILEELGLEPESVIASPHSIDYPINDPSNLQEVLSRVDSHRAMLSLFARIQAEKGDSVSFVRSLLHAHEGQVFPPVEVMAWLAGGFAQWMESNGQTRLEDCLGLREPHKGQASNTLKQANKRDQIENLMAEVLRLRIGFGLTVEESVKMSLESEWGRGYGLNTVFEKYKDWPGKRDEIGLDIFSRIDDETRKKILARYPRRAYEGLATKYDAIARNMPIDG